MSASKTSLTEAEVLRLVVEGTVSQTGTDFFRALVRNLAEVMGTSAAWVTEYQPEANRLRALAFWLNDNYLEHYEHLLPGTPCERVIHSRSLVHFPEKIIDLFPEEPDLKKYNVVSYLGIPLLDTGGAVMGHLAVMDGKPMPRDPRLISLFEIFAARAAAEQRRWRMEQQLRWREEQLSNLLHYAMDGILVLNDRFKIEQVNPAAERLFGCMAEDLLGEQFRDFLQPETAAQLDGFLKEIEAQPEGRRQLWIPQNFAALRWDRSSFPAEATLSRFENRGRVFYTLILRNADERSDAERKIQRLLEETEYLRETIREATGMGEVIGRSRAMSEVFEAIARVGPTDTTVLVLGETGTGKELIARSLHAASPRKDKPLIRVNCAAIPAALMESEFFGHERGAFTGATARREGRFALANDGTLFLDEVGELPLDLQSKLLRVLQEGEFEAVGSAQTRQVDVRVIAATNRNLENMVREGKFREDLLYRLNVFPLRLPPLRERPEDIPLLARSFLERYAARMGRRMSPLGADDSDRLQAYHWPGNVRELQNVIERAIILSAGSRLELHRAMPEGAPVPIPARGESSDGPEIRILTARELEALERANLQRALDSAGWKVSGETGAATLLGLAPSTLSSRMKALGLKRPSQGAEKEHAGV